MKSLDDANRMIRADSREMQESTVTILGNLNEIKTILSREKLSPEANYMIASALAGITTEAMTIKSLARNLEV